MKKTYFSLFFSLILCISAIKLFSQEEAKKNTYLKFIGIESGAVFYASEFKQIDLVRKQDQNNYPSDIYNKTSFYNWYLGAKIELRSSEYKLGIQTGLRFSTLNSMSGSNYSDKNNDFYYFLFNEDETAVEYMRLRGIKQKANYVGIPLEFRYLMLRSKYVKLFCKASTEFQYLVNSKSDVYFLKEEMEVHENEVIEKFNKPNKLLSTLYFSGGIKFGSDENINFNLEAVFLSFVLSDNNSIINKPLAGGGFQVNIQVPF